METVVEVSLPPGADLGLVLSGSPATVQTIDTGSPLFKNQQIHTGMYAQSLRIPSKSTEVCFIPGADLLLRYLQLFSDETRVVVLRSTMVRGPHTWSVPLPPGHTQGLGMELRGFPPVVSSVHPSSPLHPYVPRGWMVDRLVVPDQYDLSLQSGGFTDARVTKIIDDTAYAKGRILTVKNEAPPDRSRQEMESRHAFDLRPFSNSTRWTVPRMMGWDKKKKNNKNTIQPYKETPM